MLRAVVFDVRISVDLSRGQGRRPAAARRWQFRGGSDGGGALVLGDGDPGDVQFGEPRPGRKRAAGQQAAGDARPGRRTRPSAASVADGVDRAGPSRFALRRQQSAKSAAPMAISPIRVSHQHAMISTPTTGQPGSAGTARSNRRSLPAPATGRLAGTQRDTTARPCLGSDKLPRPGQHDRERNHHRGDRLLGHRHAPHDAVVGRDAAVQGDHRPTAAATAQQTRPEPATPPAARIRRTPAR